MSSRNYAPNGQGSFQITQGEVEDRGIEHFLPQNHKTRNPGDNIVIKSKAAITRMKKQLTAERRLKKNTVSTQDKNNIADLCAIIMKGMKN